MINAYTRYSPRASRFLSLNSSRLLLALCLFIGLGRQAAAQAPAVADHPKGTIVQPGLYEPAADPKAIVTLGRARFTVLTPQLIRMEWAADGKFEDRASLVFLNRKLPVPKFTRELSGAGETRSLVLKTSELTLSFSPTATDQGKFTPENLHI